MYLGQDWTSYEVYATLTLPDVGMLEEDCDEIVRRLQDVRCYCNDGMCGNVYNINDKLDWLYDAEIGDDLKPVMRGCFDCYFSVIDAESVDCLKTDLSSIANEFGLKLETETHIQ